MTVTVDGLAMVLTNATNNPAFPTTFDRYHYGDFVTKEFTLNAAAGYSFYEAIEDQEIW